MLKLVTVRQRHQYNTSQWCFLILDEHLAADIEACVQYGYEVMSVENATLDNITAMMTERCQRMPGTERLYFYCSCG